MTNVTGEAWGATLLPHKNTMNVEAPIKRAAPLTLPKTLAEALSIPVSVTNSTSVEKDELRTDLLKLRDQANQSFRILSQFTEHHNLGLSLNKIAGLIDTANDLLKKYE